MKIPLKKPVVDGDTTWDEIEVDPSVGALEAFELALSEGKPEIPALIELLSADGDTPAAVVRKIRSSDLTSIRAKLEVGEDAPLEPATAATAGAATPPTSPTS